MKNNDTTLKPPKHVAKYSWLSVVSLTSNYLVYMIVTDIWKAIVRLKLFTDKIKAFSCVDYTDLWHL